MQTTLRIDDHLYREAKAQAAREGISMTRLFEDALRKRIQSPASATTPFKLKPFGRDKPGAFNLTPAQIKDQMDEMLTERMPREDI
jgi:hypothetical protein